MPHADRQASTAAYPYDGGHDDDLAVPGLGNGLRVGSVGQTPLEPDAAPAVSPVDQDCSRESSHSDVAGVSAKRPDASPRYRTIVADPPWPADFRDRRQARPNLLGRVPYERMSVEEIAALPVQNLAADAAHLYLWTTHRMLPIAFSVVEAWGFKYECLLTWSKAVGFTPFSWMYSTEHVLFCRRGRLDLLRVGLRLDFHGAKGSHSAKPDSFLDLVEVASPGPYLELFARRNRLGWDTWGNEALNHVELSA